MISSTVKNYISPIFIGHGGGPLPILNDPSHFEMLNSIKLLKKSISKPKEILVISAHWEEKEFTILTNQNPKLLYDYYGFPEESYNLNYPIKLAKNLNEKIFRILEDKEIKYNKDDQRDFDHGVFIPLMLLFSDLDVPVTQISLKKNFNPEDHINLGRVLSELSEEGVLVLASGMSFHNMRAFFTKSYSSDLQKSEKFHTYLKNIFSRDNDMLKDKRLELLKDWENAEGARFAHPREEHLVPLFVAAGASKDLIGFIQEYEMMNAKIINVIFEEQYSDKISIIDL
jgi:4,5-DOPA dioxygenase extradiol